MFHRAFPVEMYGYLAKSKNRTKFEPLHVKIYDVTSILKEMKYPAGQGFLTDESRGEPNVLGTTVYESVRKIQKVSKLNLSEKSGLILPMRIQ